MSSSSSLSNDPYSRSLEKMVMSDHQELNSKIKDGKKLSEQDFEEDASSIFYKNTNISFN
jgi:hypothetical protein